jgi:hypothetical protein
MGFMTNLRYTKEDADEAFFNLGKMAGRLPLEEAKRLHMLAHVIASYVEQLEKKEDDFDMDGRC